MVSLGIYPTYTLTDGARPIANGKVQASYLWMIIPFLVVQIGIFTYYWPAFATNTWEIHIHYWSVSLWYLLLILQPYLAVKGKMPSHRTVGIFGFLLAGGIILSGMSLLNIYLKLAAAYVPGRPGPPVSFYYGTLAVEFLSMVAFAYAITKSILHRKKFEEHSWWLICSGFFIMAPALGRGMFGSPSLPVGRW